MALLVLKDKVKETTSTTGTGTWTCSGAVAPNRTFADIGNGNQTYYSALDPITGAWENGIGTYTSSGTTLSRDTVLSNSLGTTAKINFLNAPVVWCDYPASKAMVQDQNGVALADFTTAGTVTTTTNTFVMCGYGANWQLTPAGTGLLVMANLICRNTADVNFNIKLMYGLVAGGVPAANAAVTGTQVGKSISLNKGGSINFPCSITAPITGLTANAAIWLDAAIVSDGVNTTLTTANAITVLNRP